MSVKSGCQMVFVFKPKIPILVKFGVENVVIFYDHLEYFTGIWYNLLPFGAVCCHLVHLLRFGIFRPRKIWQPWLFNARTGNK
jgi:hypothetical protein